MRQAISDGDLCIQACADDPQVVFHAVRNLVRAARGTAVLRWSQLGFGRASATGAGQSTPRNLMGFKDGTSNIHADDGAAIDEHVWVARIPTRSGWANGSYLVARKIRMEIESWDVDRLDDQERIFGRTKIAGAPLTGGDEFTPIDFAADDRRRRPGRSTSTATSGSPRRSRTTASASCAAATTTPTARTRRPASWPPACSSSPSSGIRTPSSRCCRPGSGRNDLLNEYIAHIGGGVWAVPPGLSGAGDWYGKALLGR